MKAKINTQYFSMVDLICVIAIVATLVSMLTTTISDSKEMTHKALCMSNLAQIRTYTELYRKDYKSAPYSETWLTDFSYVKEYLSSTDDLSVFTCPSSGDEELTNVNELKFKTSYYYVPGRDVLSANLADGQAFGFSLLNIAALTDKNQLVIYDRSPDHHNGEINTAYLFGNDDANTPSGKIVTSSNQEEYHSLNGAGLLELDEAETLGSLNINPAQSTGVLFTLTDTVGAISQIKDDTIASTGQGVNITIKVKSQGRTLVIDGEVFELKTNSTYNISTTPDPDSSSSTAPYFIYELSQDGSGAGQWWLDLFAGIGTVTLTKL